VLAVPAVAARAEGPPRGGAVVADAVGPLAVALEMAGGEQGLKIRATLLAPDGTPARATA
jgi:hypothetical protein